MALSIPYMDAAIYGIGVARLTNELLLESVSLVDFFKLPLPGERSDREMWGAGMMPWGIWNGAEYDDGGGAVIAAIRFQRCT